MEKDFVMAKNKFLRVSTIKQIASSHYAMVFTDIIKLHKPKRRVDLILTEEIFLFKERFFVQFPLTLD